MSGNGIRFSAEEFIQKAQLVHGNRFDYSRVSYINQYTKVEIVCREHGPFMQFPTAHCNGGHVGCRECVKAAISARRTEALCGFVEKAKLVHGDLFDYSKITEYRGNRYKVEIVCREHGPFMQYGRVHLAGHGCPICTKTCDFTHFYLIKADSFYKPGVTSARRGIKRIREHERTKAFHEVEVLVKPTLLVGNARDVELFALGLGVSAGLSGFQACTEYRRYDERDVQLIKEMVELCRA